MNDVETRLREVSPAEPSDRLDHAIDTMLRCAEQVRTRGGSSHRSLWFALAGGAAGVVLGLLVGVAAMPGPGPAAVPPAREVIVVPSAELERWLTAGDRAAAPSFLERQHPALEAEYVAGRNRPERPDQL